MSNFVITIGREFGSNGKKIGEEVAKRLGIKCYDKELLSLAAKDSGFCEEILESNDEKPTSSFLYSLVMDTYSMNHYSTAPFLDMPLNQKVFLAQYEAIQKIAGRESCVIVGPVSYTHLLSFYCSTYRIPSDNISSDTSLLI